MSYQEALKRALATFVAGATAVPLTTAVTDVSFLKAALIAGIVAVWNLAARLSQAWLTQPEDL